MVGVHRNTLYRWLRDPVFCAAMQDVRGELRDAARLRLESMADKAALYVEHAMGHGDGRTALNLLKLLGIFDRDYAANVYAPAEDKFNGKPQATARHDRGSNDRGARQRPNRLAEFFSRGQKRFETAARAIVGCLLFCLGFAAAPVLMLIAALAQVACAVGNASQQLIAIISFNGKPQATAFGKVRGATSPGGGTWGKANTDGGAMMRRGTVPYLLRKNWDGPWRLAARPIDCSSMERLIRRMQHFAGDFVHHFALLCCATWSSAMPEQRCARSGAGWQPA